MREELDDLQRKHKKYEVQIRDLNEKQLKTASERNALDKMHKMKVERIQRLVFYIYRTENINYFF